MLVYDESTTITLVYFVKITNSSVIEDEYNLVIIYPFETPEKCKILHSFNIKHIDE